MVFTRPAPTSRSLSYDDVKHSNVRSRASVLSSARAKATGRRYKFMPPSDNVSPLFTSEVLIIAGGFQAGRTWEAAAAAALLALGFLGLGAQPPTPEWGAMISVGRENILDQWWVAAVPGIAIFVVSLGFNLLGDGLRDVLDPKMT